MNNLESKNENWERKLLEKLVFSSINEQKRTRRWGIFFKSLFFIYLFILLSLGLGWIGNSGVRIADKHTALVNLHGEISADSISSANNVNSSLREAFKDKNTQGVVLRINSPGGSPVQAGYINDEIRRLRTEYPKIPLYAVITDICASGGYYVAVAADKIFVDKASLVGSIGVLMDGFGFTGTLEKLGIERRLLTAGENKGFLDPFSPADPKQKDHAREMLKEIHDQFIGIVQQGRGDRLKDTPEIFSGAIWTGEKSIELGLADALGSTEYVAREVIKSEYIVDYTAKEGIAERFAKRFSEVSMNILSNSAWKFR
ncbi:protease-4 [Nitrosomonas cryotolerans]|uniref:Protease-4 n=1 Tax=Nitrosomonas cryotolerans ATCC 49181 TaxID=1131553 RepID=A0A1N6H873_9PROT|nr:S49 family peptidase [Nitrosomonas cryotolerans]SFP79669.1 protease-4 [Nitrosomonas cryotolerans]SIO15867.1 protease-4 [Nitrosomonas cryotolerans ATCC 49181]